MCVFKRTLDTKVISTNSKPRITRYTTVFYQAPVRSVLESCFLSRPPLFGSIGLFRQVTERRAAYISAQDLLHWQAKLLAHWQQQPSRETAQSPRESPPPLADSNTAFTSRFGQIFTFLTMMYNVFNADCDSSSRCSTASPAADSFGYYPSPGSYTSMGSPQSQVCAGISFIIKQYEYLDILAIYWCLEAKTYFEFWNACVHNTHINT